ncbi:MAG: hypothetical protein ACJAXX_000572 [Roseivirga sp.]|jgi:hypothetical protein
MVCPNLRISTNRKIIGMILTQSRVKNLMVSLMLLFIMNGCSSIKEPKMKIKRASFSRCIYPVDQRNVCWDVRAFVDVGSPTKDEEFLISLNLVIEDHEEIGPYPRIFKLQKIQVFFGTDKVYQGKDFDHQDWLGPAVGSSSNMLRLSKEKIGEGNLSVMLWVKDDKERQYKCEVEEVKIGKI